MRRRGSGAELRDFEIILKEAARLDVEIKYRLCTRSRLRDLNGADARMHMFTAEIDLSGFRCENLMCHVADDEPLAVRAPFLRRCGRLARMAARREVPCRAHAGRLPGRRAHTLHL